MARAPKNKSGLSRGQGRRRTGMARPWAFLGMLPWETRTVPWTGRERSSETTENGDVDADALLKKESPIPACGKDGAVCMI